MLQLHRDLLCVWPCNGAIMLNCFLAEGRMRTVYSGFLFFASLADDPVPTSTGKGVQFTGGSGGANGQVATYNEN